MIFFFIFRQDSHLISQVTNNNTPALVAQALSGKFQNSKVADLDLYLIHICARLSREGFNFSKKSIPCIIHGPMKICNVNVNIWQRDDSADFGNTENNGNARKRMILIIKLRIF